MCEVNEVRVNEVRVNEVSGKSVVGKNAKVMGGLYIFDFSCLTFNPSNEHLRQVD
jgi:hypothetical protein